MPDEVVSALENEEEGVDTKAPSFLEKYRQAEQSPSGPQADETKPATPDDGEGEDDKTDDLGPQLSDLAAKYGLEPQALSGFGSLEDAQRALSLFDAQLLQQGRAIQNEVAVQNQQFRDEQPEQKPLFDLNDFDEEDPVRKNFSALEEIIKLQAQRLQQMEGYVVHTQRESQRQLNERAAKEAERKLKELGLDDLSPADKQKLFDEHDALANALHMRGMTVPDTASIIERVAHYEFRDKIQKKARQKKDEAIRNRSRQKLGSPGRAPQRISPDNEGEFETNKDLIRYFYELENSG